LIILRNTHASSVSYLRNAHGKTTVTLVGDVHRNACGFCYYYCY